MGRSRRLWLGSLIAFVLVLSAAALLRDRGLLDRRGALLPEAVQKRRLLLPRLAGGFEYVPHAPVTRGSSGEAHADLDRAVAEAWKRIGRLVGRNDSDEDILAARAVLLLAQERSGDRLEKAVVELEAARAHAPGSAQIHADLSAVYYALATENEEPQGVLNALAAADEALALDPGLLEALFNRALCLEYLGLWPQARAAWWAYLEQDGDSGWGAEAREHYLRLFRPSKAEAWTGILPQVLSAADAGDVPRLAGLIADFRRDARQYLEVTLLRAWGEAELRGDEPAAGAALRSAKAFADALFERVPDPLYVEAVATLSPANGNPSALRELAGAHRDFALGVAALRVEEIDSALSLLAQARDGFELGRSPFAGRAELQMGICEERLHHYPEALDLLLLAEETAEARGFLNLQAEALWMEGLVHNEAGRLGPALEAYLKALPIIERLGDADRLAGIHFLIAERLGDTGETIEAWGHLRSALAATPEVSNPLRLYQIYTTAARLAEQAGFPDLGVLFQDVAIPIAASSGNPMAVVEAYRWRAHVHFRAGRLAPAASDVAKARSALETLSQPEQRERAEAGINAVESEMAAAIDPRAAVAKLEETLAFYRASGYELTLASALLSLARAHIALGDDAAAAGPIAESLQTIEGAREQLADETERASFLELMGAAFDERTSLELRRGHWVDAFEASEAKRARTLLDRLDRGTSRPEKISLLGARELGRRLPADRVLIEFSSIHGRMSAGLLTRAGVRWVELGDVTGIAREVDLFLRDLARRAPKSQLEADAASLYKTLIAPLARFLPEDAALVIVPDAALHGLPFAALFDPIRRTYLIERWGLAFAPSANLYVHALERDRALRPSLPLSALVIGNPEFDPRADLRLLPGAEREAHRVAALYPRADLMVGPRATQSSFFERAGTREVVHFAGHAVVNPGNPLRSMLLFAADARDPEHGALLAEEIYGRQFARTRLVVLGACSTAGGPLVPGEGVASLARPFLAAGIPAVLASLWPVEDQTTSDFLVTFHRELGPRGDALRALQAAQVEFLRSPREELRSPALWGAFQLLGEATFTRLDIDKKGKSNAG